MLELGKFQTLEVIEQTDFGVYLAQRKAAVEEEQERSEDHRNPKKRGGQDKVLLPKRYVADGLSIGDEVRVFLYMDSEDRPVATTEEPYITLDQVRLLAVKEVAKVGAFLDWGLPKDLFLPYKEMTERIHEGDEVLVRLYQDKSGRLAASMKKLYPLLTGDSPYQTGDEVEGRIYEFGHDFGTFVAVDDRYSAMVPKHEDLREHRIGDVIRARVTGVKEDGKLDLTTKKKIREQMDDDAETVMEVIASYAGVLPFTEKAGAEVIFRETGLSKNAFKRAVGRLYKQRRISLEGGKIRAL